MKRQKKLSLFHIVQASYGREKLKRFGYRLDPELSGINNKVFYNPETHKLIYTVKGTNPTSLSDIYTDVQLGLGNLKSTDRYKSAHDGLRAAKLKYHVDSATVIGHSLGGSISDNITSKNDRSVTLDSGYTFGQRTRGEEYRTSGDLVSLLGSTNKHVTTLVNPNWHTGFLPVDALLAHNPSNVKKAHIFID
jgi:hypothetical protein